MDKREQFQSEFKETKLTNQEIINKRRVINGYDDGLMQVAPLKHPWAYQLFQDMLKNNWVPQEVPMQRDVEQWESKDQLTEQEREVYSKSLAFVSNLDGLQTNNLACNIIRHITSPEIVMAVVRQTYEEALHVQSYATMVEALSLNPEEIYGLYRTDKVLYEKNQQVLKAMNKISAPTFKTGTFETDQDFLEACVGNIILEGIYFYSAFLTFYVLKRNNKMPGTAEMIQFINRDEDMHVKLYVNVVNAMKSEQPELWTDAFKDRIISNVVDAVELEYEWGKSCIGDGILGLTAADLKEYLQFVGNIRLESVGLPKLWNSTNPFPWIEEYTQGNMIEVNFFEGTVKEYQTGALEW
jgi:ribonucleoside-diphosphate reductase beta chain